MKNIHFSYNLVLLVLLSLGFLPQDVTGGNGWKYGPIDCGCPNSCNEVAWGETNGAPWTCYDRIHYFKGHYHLNDTDACLVSVHDPTMTDEENKIGMRPSLAVVGSRANGSRLTGLQLQ